MMPDTYLHRQGGPVPMKAKAIVIDASVFGLLAILCLCLLCDTGGGWGGPGNWADSEWRNSSDQHEPRREKASSLVSSIRLLQMFHADLSPIAELHGRQTCASKCRLCMLAVRP